MAKIRQILSHWSLISAKLHLFLNHKAVRQIKIVFFGYCSCSLLTESAANESAANERAALMRIWRVGIRHEQEEDKVLIGRRGLLLHASGKDGVCGQERMPDGSIWFYLVYNIYTKRSQRDVLPRLGGPPVAGYRS